MPWWEWVFIGIKGFALVCLVVSVCFVRKLLKTLDQE